MHTSHNAHTSSTSNTDQQGLQRAISVALAKEHAAKKAREATLPPKQTSVVIESTYLAIYFVGSQRKQKELKSNDLEAFKALVKRFKLAYPNVTLHYFQIDTPREVQT